MGTVSKQVVDYRGIIESFVKLIGALLLAGGIAYTFIYVLLVIVGILPDGRENSIYGVYPAFVGCGLLLSVKLFTEDSPPSPPPPSLPPDSVI